MDRYQILGLFFLLLPFLAVVAATWEGDWINFLIILLLTLLTVLSIGFGAYLITRGN